MKNLFQVQYYLQLAQQHQAALQQPQTQPQQIQTQVSQPSSGQPQVVQVASASATHQQQSAVQIVQQIVTPNGEIQQIPVRFLVFKLNFVIIFFNDELIVFCLVSTYSKSVEYDTNANARRVSTDNNTYDSGSCRTDATYSSNSSFNYVNC